MNTNKHCYLACDLGAESGRLIKGVLENGNLVLEEIHRFSNFPVKIGESLHWDLDALQREIGEGLKKAGLLEDHFESISCDSWGVDYVLYNIEGNRIDPTFHYRDPRTAVGVETILGRLPWESIFEETGIQFMPLNALFQMGAESPDRLKAAKSFGGVGDAFNHWLGGRAVLELSMASTFQLYHPIKKDWSEKLIQAAGLRKDQLPEIVDPGTPIGFLSSDLVERAGLNRMQVVASCSHDTGAAVAAVPAAGERWAYLSSGTWSLMGVELQEPIINDLSLKLNYTNEIGYGGSIRLLKNIIGMWLVQECRREWEGQGDVLDYETMIQLAGEAEPFRSLIHPADPRFIAPGGMPDRIAAFCRESGQAVPESKGAILRCALESLALLYRRTLQDIESMTGNRMDVLHIVGGGSRNRLLNQWTANALNRRVVTGPIEATAAGNILIQALALGHLDSIEEARKVVAYSFPTETFQPDDQSRWDKAFKIFQTLEPNSAN
ncbi:MAG: rhamnulokinase [Verrucomicrobia bacterium]|nr:rhamnulokinase [Verrucomicrobiota bacterium]